MNAPAWAGQPEEAATLRQEDIRVFLA